MVLIGIRLVTADQPNKGSAIELVTFPAMLFAFLNVCISNIIG